MALRFDDDKMPYIDLGSGLRIELDFAEYSDKMSLEKASEELRETADVVESSLRELRELLKDEKNLNIPINDDTFLIRFLRPRKYYAESAYELIKGYYKMKAKKDFILDNISAKAITVALEERVIQLYPKRDQHGRRIVYMETGASWNCSKVPFPELIRAQHALLTLLSLEPSTQLNGLVVIANFDKLSFSHLGQFAPKFMKNVLDCGQQYTPLRIKSIHLINNAKLFNMLFKICKPFLGQKWGQRIHFHGSNMGSLHKEIDPDSLPVKLGGNCDLPEYDGKVLVEFMEQFQEKFDELNSYGYVDQCK
ncbi:retinaldehyde-binding protein 1-like [Topomyia yanbarensis]|uniref:retinaldehyde-binding protein 1-like n=1 Tax=Topomyia yanbarensis TaxID=2498891 RepID=UPI00273A8BCB|nr:retinaldehyde-binding protein 1-like [Topomyia yanbarensis]XP_058819703.1 retinaldehyde-binding protein 1-like [Topomyia yanbarensis]XP_058819704.1 retinaldehyde-binding protein 1-like [Topomyia yanbarensis]